VTPDRQPSLYRRIRGLAKRLRDAGARRFYTIAILAASDEEREELRLYESARKEAKRAVAVAPDKAGPWRRLGHALAGLKRYKQAIACYDRALALEPEHGNAWRARRNAIGALGKAPFRDITLDPRDSRAWTVSAAASWHRSRLAEAAEASDRALSLDPSNTGAARMAIQCRLHICDWRKREDDKRRLSEGLRKGTFSLGSMDLNNVCDCEEELRLGAELEAAKIPRFAEGLWRGERYRHEKVRIAYISSEFRNHVVAACICGCFEHHDKTRFETTAISLGADDGSDYHRRIKRAFDA